MTSTQLDTASGGFNGAGDVARVKGMFTAVGPAAHLVGSEVTTG